MSHRLGKILLFPKQMPSIMHEFVKRFAFYTVLFKSLVVYVSIVSLLLILLAWYAPTMYKRPRRSIHSDSSTSSSDNDSLRSPGHENVFGSRRHTTLEVFVSSSSFSPLRALSETPAPAPPKRFQLIPPFVPLMLSRDPIPLKPQTRSRDLSPPKLQVERQSRPQKPKVKRPKLQNAPFTPEVLVDSRTKQPYEAFLVLDVEGTCQLGSDYNYPNEIIEFPVCLLQWTDRSADGKARKLKLVDEFRSFVKPTWRPILSDFCKELTGITQDEINTAPHFPEVLIQVEAFLVKNKLIEADTRKRLKRFCWCSDGPFDIQNFVVKQCFISQVKMPAWLKSDVLDVRATVVRHAQPRYSTPNTSAPSDPTSTALNCRSLNIPTQLKVLGLPEFEGRHHRGIDDARNASKIVIELAKRAISLVPNNTVNPGKRWSWMGKNGQILGVYT